MTLHLHHLTGCAPAPLAHYLKALGVLRIVAEQKDPEVRGYWQDEHFCVLTTLDRSALERFFLEEYAPTPAFNPWGARSGFYSGSSERTSRLALQRIADSDLPRLAGMQATIATVREVVCNLGGNKPEDAEEQARMLHRIQAVTRGAGADWLAAVVALVASDLRKPALLGTGGNEGSGSYVSAYCNAIVTCIIDRQADSALSLFDRQGPLQSYKWQGSFGQFLPEGSGTPWDLLLLIEGAILLRSAVTTRSTSGHSSRFLASPFYLEAHALGSGASAPADEVAMQKGRARPGRGEQWFPLWVRPANLRDLQALFADGRCSAGRNRSTSPIDAARAISRAGVARGVTAFNRYGYLQRNNLATHFAVPLGRIDVQERTTTRLIDEVAPWARSLWREARASHATSRLRIAERRLADSVFGVLTHDREAVRWQALLVAASEVEAVQAMGAALRAGPIPPLGPGWVDACNDHSPEYRLALALGSAAARYDRHRPVDSVRQHWIPLDHRGRFRQKEGRLATDPRVVAHGRDPVLDCVGLVERRMIEASARGQRHLPLVSARGCGAGLQDLAALATRRVDLSRTIALARAFMAVRWDRWRPPSTAAFEDSGPIDDGWAALRVALLPFPIREGLSVPGDPAILRKLMAGDAARAIEIALRRLRAVGLRPPIYTGSADPVTARLWAATFAFPISHAVARQLARRYELQPKEAS